MNETSVMIQSGHSGWVISLPEVICPCLRLRHKPVPHREFGAFGGNISERPLFSFLLPEKLNHDSEAKIRWWSIANSKSDSQLNYLASGNKLIYNREDNGSSCSQV